VKKKKSTVPEGDIEIPVEQLYQDMPKKKRKNLRGIAQIYDESFIEVAERLVAAGFTEKDLGYVFNCSHHTVADWKKRYPEFKRACEDGKRVMKRKMVARAMLNAVGYDYQTKKTRTIMDADGNVQKIEETKFDNKQAGNDRLLMFLLCNMDRQLGDNEWHSKQTLEVENKNLNITIDGKLASDSIRKLAGKLFDDTKTKQIESKEV